MKILTPTLATALLLGAGLIQAASPASADCPKYVFADDQARAWGNQPYVGPEVPQGSGCKYVFADDQARQWGNRHYVGPEVAPGSSGIKLSAYVLGDIEGNGGDMAFEDQQETKGMPAIAASSSTKPCAGS